MIKVFLALVLTVLSLNIHATEVVTWTGQPISLSLNINEERLVRLPDNAMFRVPKELEGVISVQSAAGILYITPRTELNNVPLEVKLASTGEIILFRVNSSNSQLQLEELLVVKNDQPAPNSSRDAEVQRRDNTRVSPIELIKYAGTRNLMPKRLWVNNPRIQQAGVPNINLRQLFGGVSAEMIDAEIMSVYQTDRYFLNVIRLQNRTPYQIDIRFTDITIDFDFASIPESYMYLGSKGQVDDESILYLITSTDITTLMLEVDPLAVFKGVRI